MIELLDPVRDVGLQKMTYAKRPIDLAGLRVGLIENTKFNSDQILQRIGDILVREYGASETRMYHKKYSSVPAHEAIIEDIRKNCDVVIAGVGDCGSCSSGSVLDGILMEKIDKPAASIITHVFVNTGKAMAKQWGVPDYKFLVMQHPIANLPDDGLDERARTILPGVLDLLLGLEH